MNRLFPKPMAPIDASGYTLGMGAILALLLSVGGRAQTPPAALPTLEMAVTVDDLPGWESLTESQRLELERAFADAFRKHRVPAAYGFVVGRLVEQPGGREALKRWLGDGLALGSHTYSHLFLRKTGLKEYEADVAKNEPVLAALGARDWRWFRYPYLSEGETEAESLEVRAFLKERGYRVAEVTTDFGDYRWTKPYERCRAAGDERALAWLEASYLKRARRALDESDRHLRKHILLLHFEPFTARMLDRLLTQYERMGVRYVTLPEAADSLPADWPPQPTTTAAAGKSSTFGARLAALCAQPAAAASANRSLSRSSGDSTNR